MKEEEKSNGSISICFLLPHIFLENSTDRGMMAMPKMSDKILYLNKRKGPNFDIKNIKRLLRGWLLSCMQEVKI
jgi:hypothetical protein